MNAEVQQKDRVKARIGTGVYFALIILLLIFLGFREPVPPPAEQGLIVNFGYTETGSGSENPEYEETVIEEVQPEVQENNSAENIQEEVLTQDNVETINIEQNDAANNQTGDNNSETPADEPVEDPQPQVDPNALFSGSSSQTNNQSDGVSQSGADQGDPNGSNQSNNYSGINTGLADAGISIGLDGRSLLNDIRVTDNSQQTGTVVIRIRVDKNGLVTKADYQVAGSTTTNSHLIKLSKDAALRAKFNKDNGAPEIQQGTITFTYKLE